MLMDCDLIELIEFAHLELKANLADIRSSHRVPTRDQKAENLYRFPECVLRENDL